MSNFEEKKYKQTLIDDTPDLWDRIDSQLGDIYTTDSAPDMDMSPKRNSSPRVTKTKEKKKINIYKVAGILAACIAIVAIPTVINSSRQMEKSAMNDSDLLLNSDGNHFADAPEDFKGIGGEDSEDYDSIGGDVADNTTVDTNESFIDKDVSTDSESHNDFQSNGKPSDKDQAVTNRPGDDTHPDEDTTPEIKPAWDKKPELLAGAIAFTITTMTNSPDIGLVYGGSVDATGLGDIPKGTTVYVSLRNLSRTELGKRYTKGDSLIVKLSDTSYKSSPDKPYFASAIVNPED